MSEMTYSYPTTMKKLRACFNCHLVKTEQQFLDKGCENCHEDWNRQEAYHNITSNFKGIISITNPKYSWAARWLHKTNLIPGFYCIDIISDNKEDDEENDEYEEEIENEEEEN